MLSFGNLNEDRLLSLFVSQFQKNRQDGIDGREATKPLGEMPRIWEGKLFFGAKGDYKALWSAGQNALNHWRAQGDSNTRPTDS
jgi:hypothetical protein